MGRGSAGGGAFFHPEQGSCSTLVNGRTPLSSLSLSPTPRHFISEPKPYLRKRKQLLRQHEHWLETRLPRRGHPPSPSKNLLDKILSPAILQANRFSSHAPKWPKNFFFWNDTESGCFRRIVMQDLQGDSKLPWEMPSQCTESIKSRNPIPSYSPKKGEGECTRDSSWQLWPH
jgi:hypothetical protein